jgi:hypothetical protein
METEVPFIAHDPVGAFLRIATAGKAGGPWGFQYESIAANQVVSIVERYLTEYRSLLRDNLDCLHALLEMIDVFTQAGWPEANRLIYRLDDLYR